MGSDREEYLKEFNPEPLELIVRISWCGGKGELRLPVANHFCKVRARFDRALNVRTGELTGVENEASYHWITWPELEKRFGFQRDHKFKVGALYRVLVREYIPQGEEKFRLYYLEQVLERNVKEPLLESLGSFEQHPDGGIRKAKKERLERIKAEHRKPVVIRHALGEFTLDRSYHWFEGRIDYLGEECLVHLEVREGETTAEVQLNKLSELCEELVNWDKRVKAYASDELLETANEWREEESELTREQFSQELGMPMITVDADGRVKAVFENDAIFGGHFIVINIDENGEFTRAEIEG